MRSYRVDVGRALRDATVTSLSVLLSVSHELDVLREFSLPMIGIGNWIFGVACFVSKFWKARVLARVADLALITTRFTSYCPCLRAFGVDFLDVWPPL